MTSEVIQIGELVYSIAGRDAGNCYLVLYIDVDSYLRIVDGKVRKVDNPKRKNQKHVRRTGLISEGIAEKLGRNKRPTNAEIREAITELAVFLEGAWGNKEVGIT